MGDEVTFPVAVYNYLDTAQTVRVEMQSADWFTPLGGTGMDIALGPGQVTGVRFPVRVDKVGRQTMTVKGTSATVADAVARSVLVVPDRQAIPVAASGTLAMPTVFASDAKKAVRENATTKVSLELVKHEGGQFAASRFKIRQERRPVFLYRSTKQSRFATMARLRACTDGRVGVTACCWLRGKHQQEFSATGRYLLLAQCDLQHGFGDHGSPVSEPWSPFFFPCPAMIAVGLASIGHVQEETQIPWMFLLVLWSDPSERTILGPWACTPPVP
jgi:hypothetical protein